MRDRLCRLNDASHAKNKQVASAFKVVSNSTFNYITYFVAFDWMFALLDTSSVVTVSSSPLSIPDSLVGCLFLNAQYLTLYQSTFRWFKTLACTTVLVGRFHHLNYSMQ